ncbi:MAG: VWA domain-containing protein [Helicobacteraceae bacterium CG2_30_36_10]|nr:MAG: VWA domain-containing protein [Helicobacteraceae bacterium CG2_30_36_10]
MSFLHPEFIYYMLPPLFILFTLLLTQKESQAHFFSQEVMSKLRVSANTLTLKARNGLFFLMGFLMILALAQPVINDGVVEVKAKSADIMIALDISDSMLASDVYPDRLKLAKKKALELIKAAPNERVGVIAFAKNSYLVSPLSFDHSVVSFLLLGLSTESITEKGTDFLSMLDVVDNSLENKSKKYLLVISDGGDSSDFSSEIQSAKEKNIAVFVLGIGTKKGAPIKLENGNFIKHKGAIIVSKLNENIAEFATSTGGVYIQNSKSDSDVKAMLREIEANSEQKELKSEEVQRYIPLFYFPAGMALLILLIATSSMSKRERVSLPSAFMLFALLFVNPHAEAGVLDFMDLKEAKEAYEAKDYESATKIYQEYAQTNDDAQAYYNAGNSLYKQEKYVEALEAYEKANFKGKELEAKKLSNMGNAHAKQGTPGSLQKAVESYENSLKINEDKETRENMEEVKKLIQKQKQEEKKEDPKEDKKDDKESKDKKEDKNKDSKDGDKSKDTSDEESQKDSKDKSDEKKDSTKSEQEKQEEQQKKQDKEKQNEEKDKNKSDSVSSSADEQEFEMSEAEEQKWLKQLNSGQNTYMYQLNNEEPKGENLDEKPW